MSSGSGKLRQRLGPLKHQLSKKLDQTPPLTGTPTLLRYDGSNFEDVWQQLSDQREQCELALQRLTSTADRISAIKDEWWDLLDSIDDEQRSQEQSLFDDLHQDGKTFDLLDKAYDRIDEIKSRLAVLVSDLSELRLEHQRVHRQRSTLVNRDLDKVTDGIRTGIRIGTGTDTGTAEEESTNLNTLNTRDGDLTFNVSQTALSDRAMAQVVPEHTTLPCSNLVVTASAAPYSVTTSQITPSQFITPSNYPITCMPMVLPTFGSTGGHAVATPLFPPYTIPAGDATLGTPHQTHPHAAPPGFAPLG